MNDPADTSPPATAPDTPGRRWPLLVAGTGVALVVAALVLSSGLGATPTPPDSAVEAPPTIEDVADPAISVVGLADGALLSASDVTGATVHVTADDPWTRTLRVTLDGEPVTVDGDDGAVLRAEDLARLEDGEHTLRAVAGDDEQSASEQLTFTLDTTPPSIELPEVVEAWGRRDPLTVDLRTTGAAEVTAEGGEVELAEQGRATATFATPPQVVAVTATDVAGNTATAELPVVVHFPGGQAVHTTPSAWRYEPKRRPIIEMLEAGLIDAVQLDIKDELGDVGWDTDVELADLSGAEDFNRNFDMAAAIEEIHSHGARVIGRLVVYRDTRLAEWAWENGRTDMVLQSTDGTPYEGRYGSYAFTNFADPEVQQYNLDIALEAAELGFDDVLYDYIRRPDGAIEDIVVPGLGERTPEEAVVEVMASAYPLLHEQGVWVGASVFGIAVDRPTQMAQSIPDMALHVDYIAPMVYPNHWGPGEYGVPVPEDAPYDIVERSLTLYREALEGTGVALMPWLQDFGGYGEAEVRAQIEATEAVTGERWFLLWASSATYTQAALDPVEPRPAAHATLAPDPADRGDG